MTSPRERAEKIHAETCGTEDPRITEDCIAWIESEILAYAREYAADAVREAVAEALKPLDQAGSTLYPETVVQELVQQAKAEAFEGAAKLIEAGLQDPWCGDDCLQSAADEIRTKAKGLK